MSLKKMLENHSNGSGANLLKASDLPAETKSITFEVASFRESPPHWDSPSIVGFKKPIQGKPEMALNKTNHKEVMQVYDDDESMLIGEKLTFDIIQSRNPKTGEIVPSFAFRRLQKKEPK
jgi:hypothetical protein